MQDIFKTGGSSIVLSDKYYTRLIQKKNRIRNVYDVLQICNATNLFNVSIYHQKC